MAVIYKATNSLNGMSYIGFAIDLSKRMAEHQKKAQSDDRQYFHNAIRKYGWDTFQWEVILDEATLDDEVRLIEEHGTYTHGYNLTKGGEGKLGYMTSDTTKDKLADAARNRIIGEKQLDTLRANAKRMKDVGHTDEVKEKLRQNMLGKPKTAEHKANISKGHAAHKETGAYYQSPEYKDKMSKALKGKTRTPEQRERYRQAALKRHQAKQQRVLQGF
jgi:group I intron endonuclease